jgi:hypothetical protein
MKGIKSGVYATAILGELFPGNKYYYRVGYCPAIEYGDLLVAKTLLLPGMRGTPEHAWARTNLTSAERSNLDSLFADSDTPGWAWSGDFSLMKQFHDGGIKQVTALDHEVFRFP